MRKPDFTTSDRLGFLKLSLELELRVIQRLSNRLFFSLDHFPQARKSVIRVGTIELYLKPPGPKELIANASLFLHMQGHITFTSLIKPPTYANILTSATYPLRMVFSIQSNQRAFLFALFDLDDQ